MTDNEFLLRVLSDGEWHSRDQILAESFRERGCGLTVHSRISNLRERGHRIECKVSGGSRRASFYRLGVLEEASVSMAGDRSYIEERVDLETDTGCWVWTAGLSLDGYGKYNKRGPHRNRNAHCVAYEVWVGPVPEGMQLDHLCRNKACVNPAHLDPVTHLENVRRAWGSREPKTHCVRGHEFTPENTYELKYTPGRQCRTCHREDTRRYRELKRNGALEEGPGVDGRGSSSSASIPADSLAADRAGALEPLFVCEIDESAGLRGAYGDG